MRTTATAFIFFTLVFSALAGALLVTIPAAAPAAKAASSPIAQVLSVSCSADACLDHQSIEFSYINPWDTLILIGTITTRGTPAHDVGIDFPYNSVVNDSSCLAGNVALVVADIHVEGQFAVTEHQRYLVYFNFRGYGATIISETATVIELNDATPTGPNTTGLGHSGCANFSDKTATASGSNALFFPMSFAGSSLIISGILKQGGSPSLSSGTSGWTTLDSYNGNASAFLASYSTSQTSPSTFEWKYSQSSTTHDGGGITFAVEYVTSVPFGVDGHGLCTMSSATNCGTGTIGALYGHDYLLVTEASADAYVDGACEFKAPELHDNVLQLAFTARPSTCVVDGTAAFESWGVILPSSESWDINYYTLEAACESTVAITATCFVTAYSGVNLTQIMTTKSGSTGPWDYNTGALCSKAITTVASAFNCGGSGTGYLNTTIANDMIIGSWMTNSTGTISPLAGYTAATSSCPSIATGTSWGTIRSCGIYQPVMTVQTQLEAGVTSTSGGTGFFVGDVVTKNEYAGSAVALSLFPLTANTSRWLSWVILPIGGGTCDEFASPTTSAPQYVFLPASQSCRVSVGIFGSGIVNFTNGATIYDDGETFVAGGIGSTTLVNFTYYLRNIVSYIAVPYEPVLWEATYHMNVTGSSLGKTGTVCNSTLSTVAGGFVYDFANPGPLSNVCLINQGSSITIPARFGAWSTTNRTTFTSTFYSVSSGDNEIQADYINPFLAGSVADNSPWSATFYSGFVSGGGGVSPVIAVKAGDMIISGAVDECGGAGAATSNVSTITYADTGGVYSPSYPYNPCPFSLPYAAVGLGYTISPITGYIHWAYAPGNPQDEGFSEVWFLVITGLTKLPSSCIQLLPLSCPIYFGSTAYGNSSGDISFGDVPIERGSDSVYVVSAFSGMPVTNGYHVASGVFFSLGFVAYNTTGALSGIAAPFDVKGAGQYFPGAAFDFYDCPLVTVPISENITALNAPSPTGGWILTLILLMLPPAMFIFVMSLFDIGVDTLILGAMLGLSLGVLLGAVAGLLPWGATALFTMVIALYLWRTFYKGQGYG
jgi:hypothetical protein